MKYIAFILMLLYLYSLCFGPFFTLLTYIPAPVLFVLPLLFFFKIRKIPFLYRNELLAFYLAIFLYDIVGLPNSKSFIFNTITITTCAIYFNYFVGSGLVRFQQSVLAFFGLLLCSAMLLILNPFYPEQIDHLRSVLMGAPVVQSPSGIAIYQFNFSYQLIALASCLFVYTFVFKEHPLLKIIVLLNCLTFIYLSMQCTVIIGFLCSASVFLCAYYKYKGILMVAGAVFAGLLLYHLLLRDNFEWACSPEVTSQNAYRMFLIYVGPFLGTGLLIILYYKVFKIACIAFSQIRKQENALMICLCSSFLAATINSFFHNSWLLNANGPSIFLYFSILHLHYLTKKSRADVC